MINICRNFLITVILYEDRTMTIITRCRMQLNRAEYAKNYIARVDGMLQTVNFTKKI